MLSCMLSVSEGGDGCNERFQFLSWMLIRRCVRIRPTNPLSAEEAVKRSAYTFLTKLFDLDKLFAILDTIQQQVYSDFLEKP